jgi:hypothetical protein
MTPTVAGYVALDNIRHNGVKYESGDELDSDDFTEQQLEQLLSDGVIIVGMVGVKETDISDDPDAGDKTDIGNEPDVGDKTGTGDEPDAGDKTDTGDEPGAGDKADIGDETQTGAEAKPEASDPTAKPKKK